MKHPPETLPGQVDPSNRLGVRASRFKWNIGGAYEMMELRLRCGYRTYCKLPSQEIYVYLYLSKNVASEFWQLRVRIPNSNPDCGNKKPWPRPQLLQNLTIGSPNHPFPEG